MDFANGEILFHNLRLIAFGVTFRGCSSQPVIELLATSMMVAELRLAAPHFHRSRSGEGARQISPLAKSHQ
jgi:hypothetical protein